MKVNILASGSGGNCIALRSGDTTILVDAGIAKTKIENRLLEVGIRPDEIKAIFVTHAHKDHICGLTLANKYKIPVYASEGEWQDIQNVDNDLRFVMDKGQFLKIDEETYIYPFDVHHDAYQPLGYCFLDREGIKCSICLDTGKVDERMLKAMEHSNIYIIEANHDEDMVEASDYPSSVKARILSHIGHLSNLQTANALTKIVRGLGEKIYLTHLSTNNNLPALAEGTVKRALASEGLKAGEDYEIEVI